MNDMKHKGFARFCLCVLLVLSFAFADVALCSQYESADYDDYYGEMMLFFNNAYYSDALAQYLIITQIWPESLDRIGNCDDYALYAKGMVALSEKRYSDALSAFSALSDDFPADNNGAPKAGMLTRYARGFVCVLSGDTEKALEAFYECRGTLNASGMYEALSKPPRQPMSDLSVVAQSATSVTVRWRDENIKPKYYVLCAPDGAANNETSVTANDLSVEFTNLIPDTKYLISVMPDTDSAALPLSGSFTTPPSKEKAPYSIAIRSTRLYQYNAQIAESMGLNVIMRLINNGSTGNYYSLVEDSETVTLPYAKFEHAAKSYLLFYSLNHDKASDERDVIVDIVLRPSTGGAYVVTDSMSLLKGTNTGNFLELGALLDLAYENSAKWPEGHAGLEIYVNGALVEKMYIKLTV